MVWPDGFSEMGSSAGERTMWPLGQAGQTKILPRWMLLQMEHPQSIDGSSNGIAFLVYNSFAAVQEMIGRSRNTFMQCAVTQATSSDGLFGIDGGESRGAGDAVAPMKGRAACLPSAVVRTEGRGLHRARHRDL